MLSGHPSPLYQTEQEILKQRNILFAEFVIDQFMKILIANSELPLWTKTLWTRHQKGNHKLCFPFKLLFLLFNHCFITFFSNPIFDLFCLWMPFFFALLCTFKLAIYKTYLRFDTSLESLKFLLTFFWCFLGTMYLVHHFPFKFSDCFFCLHTRTVQNLWIPFIFTFKYFWKKNHL